MSMADLVFGESNNWNCCMASQVEIQVAEQTGGWADIVNMIVRPPRFVYPLQLLGPKVIKAGGIAMRVSSLLFPHPPHHDHLSPLTARIARPRTRRGSTSR